MGNMQVDSTASSKVGTRNDGQQTGISVSAMGWETEHASCEKRDDWNPGFMTISIVAVKCPVDQIGVASLIQRLWTPDPSCPSGSGALRCL